MAFIYAVPRFLPDDVVLDLRATLTGAGEEWISAPGLGSGAGQEHKAPEALHAESSAYPGCSEIIGRLLGDFTRPEALLLKYFAEPATLSPASFLRFGEGASTGPRVLDAFGHQQTGPSLRADLMLVIFLSDPEAYDGGELVLNGDLSFSPQFKPPAAAAVLFDASIVQRVNPVTRGARLTVEFILESRIADPVIREMNGDLLECLNILSGESADAESERSRYLMTKLEKVRARLIRHR